MPEQPIILGVYCYLEITDHGTAGTVKKDQLSTYYYVRYIDDNEFELQPLNNKNIPSGIFSVIDRYNFLLNYQPEPQFYNYYSPPEMESLLNKLDWAYNDFDRQALNASEKKLIQALLIDESYINNADIAFRCENQDYIKLKQVLEMLKGKGESSNFVLREQLNDFGINLRKDGYYEESINYHQKTLEINEYDEHVYFNLARTYFEKGNILNCIDYLEKALELNPQFEEARKFIRYCRS